MKSLSTEERRRFLQQAGTMLGITVCAGSMAALLNACERDDSKIVANHGNLEINLSTEGGLANIGDGIKKNVGSFNNGKPVIIVRTSASTFLVVSAICNHAGCEVSAPKTNGAVLICSFADNKCGHDAEFSPSTGLQTRGPNGGSASGGLSVIPNSYNSATNVLTMVF